MVNASCGEAVGGSNFLREREVKVLLVFDLFGPFFF